MIRRDYIIRAIEEAVRALAEISGFRQDQRWEEAQQAIETQCKALTGLDERSVAKLSEMELLALVAQDQPTSLVQTRLFLVISLLKEAGEVAAAQGQVQQGHDFFLKALHVLLGVSAENEAGELPSFVPRVETLLQSLSGAPLPFRTLTMLMQHYERTGQFALAEDMLYSILEEKGDDREGLAFGVAFYQRILRQNDATLLVGNLPRAEILEGLGDLTHRQKL
jgi:hypothetical protein